MRDLVADKVHDARQQAEVRKFLARVRGQAIIEWKNDELKKMYEKQVASRARAEADRQLERAGSLTLRDGEGMNTDAPTAWYAIWTRSRHEQMVREQLERKGYEAFLPTIPRWSRWKDRKKKIDWPLFPGYCFARFDTRRASAHPQVLRRRQHRLVRRRHRPHPGLRDRRDPPAGRKRSAVRSLSADS